jgi:hypothetical protein
MIETYANVWDLHDRGEWIAIPTNGYVTKRGMAVMGRGVALQAANRFPTVPSILGARIEKLGNHVHVLAEQRMFSFPTKYHWRDRADLVLIQQSCDELMARMNDHRYTGGTCYLPRPGCGEGRLDWQIVRDAIYERLDDRVVVITNGSRQ